MMPAGDSFVGKQTLFSKLSTLSEKNSYLVIILYIYTILNEKMHFLILYSKFFSKMVLCD